MLFALVLTATASVGPRCHTARFHDAGFDSAAFAEPDPYRPAEAGYVDSATLPIRVHYRREQDAERAETVLLPIAEEVWRTEVETMGWPAPPADFGLGGDDRYDYYLTNEETYGGAWTWGTGDDVDGTDAWFSQSSFIALDDRWITDEDMPDFVSHEFNHALQYTIDGAERTLFVWESTAEAMEDLVYDDTNLYMIDIGDFQSLPWISVLFDSYSAEVKAYNDYSYYEYGGSIFGLYVEQHFGSNDGTTLLRMWEDLAQGGRGPEPDFVDAMGELAGDRAAFADTYREFAVWRMFAGAHDDGAHFEEGALWPPEAEVTLSGTYDVADLDGFSLTPTDAPYHLGANYFGVTNTGGESRSLRLSLTGDGATRWSVVGVAWPTTGGPATIVQGAATADLPLAGADRYMVAVVNEGPADLDPETSEVDRAEYTLSFAVVDPDTDPPDDSGPADDTAAADDTGDSQQYDPPCCKPDAVACGCTSGGAGAGAGGALLGGVALVTARRRRR